MNRYLILLIFSPLLFAACGDKLPTENDQEFFNHYDTALTDNSFLLNGANHKDARIDMSGGVLDEWSLRSDGGMTAVLETGYITLPGKEPQNMTLVLQFPSDQGSFAWVNLFRQDPDSTTTHMAVTISGKKYLSVEGTTEVILMRNVFYEIAGRYAGKLANAFGDTITITDGRFSVRSDE